MGSHIIGGEFQSDKYPTCPRGKVPLSVKDPTAQDLLWEYAQRRRVVDAEFSHDLESALLAAGYAGAWIALARALGSTGDNPAALAAATRGLELAPRDPDLLRSQAAALAALDRSEVGAAMAAYDRFRAPDRAGYPPTCPRGKVPLSVKDPTAQDLLWEYAQQRRVVDAEFSHDLESALLAAGYIPPALQSIIKSMGPSDCVCPDCRKWVWLATPTTARGLVAGMAELGRVITELLAKRVSGQDGATLGDDGGASSNVPPQHPTSSDDSRPK